MLISGGIGKLATALAKAQGVMDDALKLNKNPHFKSSYADLAAVRAAIQKPLSENGLAYVQLLSTSNDGLDVKTMLIHGESGEYIGDTLTIPLGQQRTPQAVGSAASYGRRYGLMALIGIAAEDDDGNAAQESAQDGKYGIVSTRKSSAKAKRDGDWEKLTADMRDAQSAVSLQRLWDSYRQGEYQTWNEDWRREAEELFAHRMAEFSAGEGLKETLEDSLEAELPTATFASNARERAKGATGFVTPTAAQVECYRERMTWLRGAKTAKELKERASNAEHLREINQLTPGQLDNLRAVYLDQGAILAANASAG